MTFLRKLRRSLKSRTASSAWAKKLAWLEYDHPGDFAFHENALELTRFGISIPREGYGFLLDGYRFLLRLHETHQCHLALPLDVSENLIHVELAGIKCRISTYDELFILNEVFAEGVYNLTPATHRPFTVVDIGMNVGITAMYFASRSEVDQVYAFEPFSPTFDRAQANLTLNPVLAQKIQAHPFGLGGEARILEVSYDPTSMGKMGILGAERTGAPSASTRLERIDIRPAGQSLEAVLEKHPRVVLKVDCEGAEYEIFEALEADGLLSKFTVVCVEWHLRGPEMLHAALRRSGFTTLCLTPHNRAVGLLYAFK